MDISFFRRGIRLSRRPAFGPVKDLSPPKRVVLLPGHEFHKQYKQVVKASDLVKAGDPIAVTDGGDVLHAPIDGEVKFINDVLCADGRRIPAVAIEAGEDNAARDGATSADSRSNGDDLSAVVRKAGVVQTGVAARLLADLVEEARDSKTEHAVIRFFDRDPYLGALEVVATELDADSGDLKTGIDIIKKLVGASKVHFVLDKEQSAANIERIASENQCTVHRVDAFDYPAMTDALLAVKVLGKENDIDPSAVHMSGAFVLDISTVIDVVNAVSTGKCATQKTITVFGGGVSKSLRVKIGTSIGDILDSAGVGHDFAKVILGGPLTGQACHDLEYPLTKDIDGITLQGRDDVALAADHQCISCGLCTMACPMRLVPGMLSRYCEYDDWDNATAANLFTCIECGCCAYVCPAQRSMVQLFSHGKKEILAGKES